MIIKIKYAVYNFEHIGVPKDSHTLINNFFCKKSYFQRLLLHSIALKSNKCQNQHSCCRSNSCIKQSWLFFFPLLSIKDEAQQVRRTSPNLGLPTDIWTSFLQSSRKEWLKWKYLLDSHTVQPIFNLSEKQDNNVNICSENTNSKKHMSATQKTAFITTVKAALQEEVLFPRHVLIAAVLQYVCLDCRHYRKTGKM